MRINSLHDALAYFPDYDGLWQAQHLSATEAKILSLLPTNWEIQWSTTAVELLTQLARVQALQDKMIEARESLDKARRKIDECGPELSPRCELRWLLENGRVLCLAKTPRRAHDIFGKAWQIANDINEPFFAVDAALMLSTLRPPKFQNEWLKNALAVVEKTDDPKCKQWMAQLLFLDGWHAYDFRQFDIALERFDSALTQPMIVEDEEKNIAILWSKARTLRAVGKITEARDIQEALMVRMQAKGKVSGYVYLELAECEQALNAKEKARAYFESAYSELSSDGWYSDNNSTELERMKYLYKKR